ncbi:DUF89 family protein [Methanohalophilus sp. RSK]|uniref:damage-control phosphatase ARMT1 family protein n=1 Tax=Methanohalophilus sp. RSK TaxID=2485783 RepID=UPI000F439242|nr:ARMT1-like domain-containing protein [Methanohalophilus sp. RSK]RNI12482.1 DUF89 family protein [Methanohalophilus sp. RSK]
MKMDPRCTYCLLSRVHYEAELATDDTDKIYRAITECMDVMRNTYRPGVAAGVVSTAVHRKAYEIIENNDPYYNLKELSNSTAQQVYPVAKGLIYQNGPSLEEAFRRAILAAVIGNYFDFGIMGFDVGEDVFDETFRNVFHKGLDVDDTSEMFKLLDNVVYVADNCGEIILDTFVFDLIKKAGGNITLVVRGEPILTDVTMADVRQLNLEDKVDRILTTGCNAIGVAFDEAPQELLEAFDKASLIISKGMANYETLSERKMGPIAYLLQTKCESVAQDMGLEKGYSVAKLMR